MGTILRRQFNDDFWHLIVWSTVINYIKLKDHFGHVCLFILIGMMLLRRKIQHIHLSYFDIRIIIIINLNLLTDKILYGLI